MSTQPKHKYTVDEYFAIEKASEDIRHEYFNGEIFAMTGSSLNHNLINMNLCSLLREQLKGKGCNVLATDMRVKVSKLGMYTYPDLVVFCGKAEIEKIQGVETLLNPVLMIEVLSKYTANYDKGTKFDFYRSIDSFQTYLLVDQNSPHVILYIKQPDGKWLMSEAKDLATKVEIPSLDCIISLKDIYQDIEFFEE